jgi:hypothetical protein
MFRQPADYGRFILAEIKLVMVVCQPDVEYLLAFICPGYFGFFISISLLIPFFFFFSLN